MVKNFKRAESEDCAIILKCNEKNWKSHKLVAYIIHAPNERRTFSVGDKFSYCLRNGAFSVKAKSSKSKIYKECGFKVEYEKLGDFLFFYRQFQISMKAVSDQGKTGTLNKLRRLFSQTSRSDFSQIDRFDSKSEFESESDECKFNKTRFHEDEVDLVIGDSSY